MVACEVARYLLKNGVNVKGVLLIDPPSPLKHIPLFDSLLDHVVNLDRRHAGSEIGNVMKTQFAMNSRLLGMYDPLSSEWPWPTLALLRSSEGFDPPGLPDVPGWLADRSDPTQIVSDWESLVGKTIKVWAIPGHHFQPFDPSLVSDISSLRWSEIEHLLQIAEVARRMVDGCQYLESL